MNGALLFDILLCFVLVAYAITGYRQGLLASIGSIIGFLTGSLVAMWKLPELLARWDAVADDLRLRILVLVLGVVLLGWLGQFLGSLLGATIRGKVKLGALRTVDAVLGSVLVVLAAAAIMWFLGGALRSSGTPALAKLMSESQVLRSIGAVMPQQTGQVFADFRGFLSDQGFPKVFEGLAPEPITPVEAPDPAIAQSAAIAAARQSVVKITAESDSCQQGQEGTGWVLSTSRIVTNAHVVAGADRVHVQVRNRTVNARVVVFDPDRDLAVLSVQELDVPALPLGDELEQGELAAVPGYPMNGPYVVVSARVRAVLDARGYDIYNADRVLREIYSLYTQVRPGNSGGPLLDIDGRVVGVIFAKSLDDDSTGYALTLDEAKPVLDAAASATRAIDTGACLIG
jgi:S1-C subfamily serine protease